MSKEIPELPAYLDTSAPDVNLWHVWCAFCRCWHTHGAGKKTDDPMTFLGHRVAHCQLPDSPYQDVGYRLVYGGRWSELTEQQQRHGPHA